MFSHFFKCRMKRENFALSQCRRVGKVAKSDVMSVYLPVRPPVLLSLSLCLCLFVWKNSDPAGQNLLNSYESFSLKYVNRIQVR